MIIGVGATIIGRARKNRGKYDGLIFYTHPESDGSLFLSPPSPILKMCLIFYTTLNHKMCIIVSKM